MPQEVLSLQFECLNHYHLDALVAMSGENFRYTTGTQAPSMAAVRARHSISYVTKSQTQRAFVVDIDVEYVRGSSSLSPGQITAYNEFTQKPICLLAEALLEEIPSIKRLGIELDYLPACDYFLLQQALPGVEILDATPIFTKLREIKCHRELEAIHALGTSAEQVVHQAFCQFHLGMCESDIGLMLINGFRAIGGDKLTLTTVASGRRSCMLNCEPSERVIQRGDVVRVDLIGTKDGYCCDVCRTFVAGEAQDAHHVIWNSLVAIHDGIMAQLKPMASTLPIYRGCADALEAGGYTPINFVGHGLGLSLHEEPYINRYKNSILMENMVLCIEPICVVEGKYGFQLENELVITQTGCSLITGASGSYKTLPVLGGN